jgi:hypothetical protein
VALEYGSSGSYGLRYLAAFRTITEHAPTAFKPKPWLDVYRAEYKHVVVYNHFLFAVVMRPTSSLYLKLGIADDAVIAMQLCQRKAAT